MYTEMTTTKNECYRISAGKHVIKDDNHIYCINRKDPTNLAVPFFWQPLPPLRDAGQTKYQKYFKLWFHVWVTGSVTLKWKTNLVF